MKPIEEKLEIINKSTPDLPLHRAHLRRALLASKQFEGPNYSFMKKLLPVGLALVLLLMFNAVQKPDSTLQITPTASAQEILANVVEGFQSLSDEEIAALNERLKVPDCGDLLMKARNAKDLHIEEDWILTANPDGSEGITIYFGEGEGSFVNFGPESVETNNPIKNYEDLTVLAYTLENGSKVDIVIDVNNDYIPVMMIVTEPEYMDENGESSQTIQFIAPGDAISEEADQASELIVE